VLVAREDVAILDISAWYGVRRHSVNTYNPWSESCTEYKMHMNGKYSRRVRAKLQPPKFRIAASQP